MVELIENELLLPCLEIGMDEEVFWNKSPKELSIYFKAYRNKKERENKIWTQRMWQMGIYVKAAIASTVVPAGLYDGKHKLAEYPSCPHTEIENNPNEQDEQWVKNERLRCYAYFKSLGSHN